MDYLELWWQHRQIVLNNAPQSIVIDTERAVDQPVVNGNECLPGDFGMGGAEINRNMTGGFTYELQIAQGGIVDDSAGQKISLLKPISVNEHFSGEFDNVGNVEMPSMLLGISH